MAPTDWRKFLALLLRRARSYAEGLDLTLIKATIARHRRSLSALAIVAVLLGLFLAFWPYPEPLKRPPLPEGRPQPEIIGFYVNWGGEQFSSLESLLDNWELMDTISPFWYSINAQGQVVDGRHVEEAFRFAKEKGLEVVVLINNKKGEGYGNAGMLRTAELRRRAAENIAELVESKGYDGVNIDFEAMPPESRDAFTSFMRELAARLRPKGKVIAASVFPKVDISPRIHGAHDWRALGEIVDYLVLMLYDRHWASGRPGPVSPLPWVQANVDAALKVLPPEKIVVAVGTYGYDWPPRGRGTDVATRDAFYLARQVGANIKRDQNSGQLHFVYWKNGQRHEVWFQDRESTRQRLEIVRELGLRGIAIWRIGTEEAGYWEVIESYCDRGNNSR